MQPELALRGDGALAARIPASWRRPLVHLGLAWAALLALFAPVWADMAMQWWDASTYNHILFVPLILGWLVWQRAPQLAALDPVGWWPGLLVLAGGLFIWLLGDISGLALATHVGVIVAMQACVLALLGPRVSLALLFPLAYAGFLVPFGDEMVPLLQMVTAHLTIGLTTWSGIPAIIEGVFIDTPAGLFEVAEACSGVKFLVAMIALGVLAAHVCFVSPRRRVLFILAAVTLPVLANGVRAWGTIYIAQSQGIAFAQGFDHIFYGWVFFALVTALLFAMSWKFFDRGPTDLFIDAERIRQIDWVTPFGRFEARGGRLLVATVLLALGFVAWSAQARQIEADIPESIDLPQVAGWERVDYAPVVWWEPRASGADHRLLGSYRNAEGAEVDVFVALYSAQEDGREAGAFGEGALMAESAWRWHSPGPAIASGTADWLQAGVDHHRLAVTLYRHRSLLVGSVTRLKLSNMRDRLTFSPRPTTMLIVSAEDRPDRPAQAAIESFLSAIVPQGEWLDRFSQKH